MMNKGECLVVSSHYASELGPFLADCNPECPQGPYEHRSH